MTRPLPLLLALQAALALPLFAYPPAPGVTIHGLVRDEYGWVLAEEGTEIIFKVGANEVARSVVSNFAFDDNYRILLPIDSGRTGVPYRLGALTASELFTVEIHTRGAVYFPVETLLGGIPLPPAGTSLKLDLNLGIDTDRDGLPDDWEYWQLQAAGLFPGHPDYNLDYFGVPGDADRDGVSDYDEYLAGTMAAFPFDTLELEVIQFLEAGLLEMEYTAVFEKAYILEMSDHEQVWVPVPIALDNPLAPPRTSWMANQTRRQKIYAPADGPTRIFRLRVR